MIDWLSAKTFAVIFSAALLGGMVSFTFFIVPMLRRVLKRALARDLLRRLFPAYYHYCTLFAIAAGVAAALTEFRHEAVALAILGATFIFARTHLLRAVRALQPPEGGRAGYTIQTCTRNVDDVELRTDNRNRCVTGTPHTA